MQWNGIENDLSRSFPALHFYDYLLWVKFLILSWSSRLFSTAFVSTELYFSYLHPLTFSFSEGSFRRQGGRERLKTKTYFTVHNVPAILERKVMHDECSHYHYELKSQAFTKNRFICFFFIHILKLIPNLWQHCALLLMCSMFFIGILRLGRSVTQFSFIVSASVSRQKSSVSTQP